MNIPRKMLVFAIPHSEEMEDTGHNGEHQSKNGRESNISHCDKLDYSSLRGDSKQVVPMSIPSIRDIDTITTRDS
jgi:hypothetical protein